MKMMSKRGLVTAVAATMAVGASFAVQAGVEVYGKARMSLDFINNDDSTAGREDSTVSLSSNTSRLGFKGDEDLGNGLSALWQLETQVDFDTGSAFQSARNTFIGLGGGFGTVLLGHHDTPNKIASAPLDIFSDTRADFNAIVGGDVRADNVIAYISPDMSGFKVLAAYIPSYVNDTLVQSQAANDSNAISLAGIYANGPIYVAAAYESLAEAGAAAGDDLTDMKLAGTFDFGQGTKVGALFEQVDDGTDSWNNWYLNVSHAMGDTTLKAAYGNADETVSGADDAATQFALGVSQAMTKNTEVYALYTMLSNDPKSTHALNGVGNGGSVGGSTVDDASAFSFGINHKFSSK